MVLMMLVGVPVVGGLLGGIYSVPAMWATKSRDPAYTILLAVGLAMTTFGIGLGTRLPLAHVSAVYLASLLVLVVRRALGPLDDNIERFGMVHAFTLAGMGWLWVVGR